MSEYESIQGTRVKYLTSDPTLDSSTEGQVWYNSTSGTNKALVQIKSFSSSGTATARAGGGGGFGVNSLGAGGSGGGGTGACAGTAGTANTGGGAGGAGATPNPGINSTGGSGIVIIRYRVQ